MLFHDHMMSDIDSLFAVVQYDDADRAGVRRVLAPFPDPGAAAAFALDNELRHFMVRPLVLAAGAPLVGLLGTDPPAPEGTGPARDQPEYPSIPAPRLPGP
jgi:hypothetical protein